MMTIFQFLLFYFFNEDRSERTVEEIYKKRKDSNTQENILDD